MSIGGSAFLWGSESETLIPKGEFLCRMKSCYTGDKDIREEPFYMGAVILNYVYYKFPPSQPPSLPGSSHLSCSWGQRDSWYYLSCGLGHQLASFPEHLVPWMFISPLGVLEEFCIVPRPLLHSSLFLPVYPASLLLIGFFPRSTQNRKIAWPILRSTHSL